MVTDRFRRRVGVIVGLVLAIAAFGSIGADVATAKNGAGHERSERVKHVVVVYEENHSFDNLYGRWEGVRGLARARRAHTRQIAQNGARYKCLLQDDVNLTAPPLSDRCHDTNPTDGSPFRSHFPNGKRRSGDGNPFPIDSYIPASARTCPDPSSFGPANGVPDGSGLPGGCTRDLVHRYYQEQYQLNGGRQNRYTTGSDAVGLTQGYYDTRQLPIYRYLHSRGHPRYAISDDFFQGAFGGSFLNHQWLIAARTPFWPGAPADGGATDLHSIADANGMPNNYPLYKSTNPVKDQQLTEACPSRPAQHSAPPRDRAHGNSVCGDWAVNTTQPPFQPYSPGTAATKRLPAQTASTIGDRLSQKGRSWAWYSGGWSNADGRVGDPGWTNGNGPVTKGTNARACSDPGSSSKSTYPFCPDNLFQFHHQPFNYYAAYARTGPDGDGPETRARARHLRDEQEFIQSARASGGRCKLRDVSFVKPVGAENEHPGYASEPNGSDHLVDLLKTIERSACRKDTMVVVTYDEFGGAWDHVPPPGQGGTRGAHDAWGPGTRVPALTLTPGLRGRFVTDHTQHDTTSILATIEHRFGLAPLNSRDAHVQDMFSVLSARPARAHGHRHRNDDRHRR